MASTRRPRQPIEDDSFCTSCFQRVVYLYDWWLIESEEEFEGKKLAVAGFDCSKFGGNPASEMAKIVFKSVFNHDRANVFTVIGVGGQTFLKWSSFSQLVVRNHLRLRSGSKVWDEPMKPVIRVFKSAPIIKVYDFSTLETADGVCVVVNGFLNKSRTTENGFSSVVFKHFVFGFPTNWETLNLEYIRKKHKEDEDMETFGMDRRTPCQTNNVNGKFKHGDIQNSDSTEGAQNCNNDMGSDISKAGIQEILKESSIPVSSACSPHPVTEGNGNSRTNGLSSRKTRSKTAAELSGRKTRSKTAAELSGRKMCGKPTAELFSRRHSTGHRGRLSGKDSKSGMANDLGTKRNSNVKVEVKSSKRMGSETTGTMRETIADSGNKGNSSSKRGRLTRKKTMKSKEADEGGDPHMQARSPATANLQGTSFSSPDSLKRSRSGRRLLPRLEFWRNQLAIYDVDRNVAGIQEGLNIECSGRRKRN